MLDTIRLRNFRQHKDTLIKLVPGINTIVGGNNSGKSTIPEGIEFALFGSRALRDDAKGFITDGERDGSAVIKLTIADSCYTVGRNSRNAELYKNGVLEGQYKDNVSREIAALTGVSQTGFRLGHYVRQKELAAFSQLRPGKRHETIEKMLKVNAVDKAIARVKEEHTALEQDQKILLTGYTDVDTSKAELTELYSDHTAQLLVGERFESDLVAIKAKIANLRAIDSARRVAIEKAASNERIKKAWTDAVNKAAAACIEFGVASAALSKLDWSAYDTCKSTVEELHKQEVAYAKMSAIRRELDNEPVKPEKLDEPDRPDRTALHTAEAEILMKEKQLSLLKVLVGESVCPTCQQTVADVTEVVGALSDEISKLQTVRKRLDREYAVAMSEYNNLSAKFKQYNTQLATYNERMQRRAQLLEAYVDVTFSPEAKREAEAELARLQRIKEESIRLTGEIARLEALSVAPEEPVLEPVVIADDVSAELKQCEQTETDLYRDYRTYVGMLTKLEGRIAVLESLVEKNEATRKAIVANTASLTELKREMDTFSLFKRHLSAKIRPMLQEVAEALFHRVTKNRYASYQLGSDYEISITTHKGYVRKLVSISGSENDLACLCLRLAIATLRSSKLAGSLGFIILDEISGSFDDERTRQTLDGLLELRDVIPQIINITHKPVEMQYADRLFTVTEQNAVASVTYV